MSINFLTINTNGLNHPAKRASMWKTALSTGCDILCIQETHFACDSAPQCQHKSFPHIFKADYSRKQRGVLIAIRDTLAFKLLNSYSDPEGRFFILVCTLDNVTYTLVNICAPNNRQMKFHKATLKKIHEMQKGHILMCGDFNLVSDFVMDSSSSAKRLASPPTAFFFQKMTCMIYGDVITQLRGTIHSIPSVITHTL